MTRSLAELLEEPVRDPEHAAAGADVLAEQDDAVVVGHLVVQRVADRGDDVLLGSRLRPPRTRGACARRRVGVRRLPGRGDRAVDLGLDLVARSARAPPRSAMPLLAQVRREPVDRVVVACLLDLLARAVGLVVVVGGVREEAVRLALDQRGALAGARAVVRLASSPRSTRARRCRRRRRRGSRSPRRGRRRRRPPSAWTAGTLIAYWLFSQTKITGQLVDRRRSSGPRASRPRSSRRRRTSSRPPRPLRGSARRRRCRPRAGPASRSGRSG